MTTVEEARAALLALAPADGPFAQRVEAFETAVRAEGTEEAEAAFHSGRSSGYDQGLAESAQELAALREARDLYVGALRAHDEEAMQHFAGMMRGAIDRALAATPAEPPNIPISGVVRANQGTDNDDHEAQDATAPLSKDRARRLLRRLPVPDLRPEVTTDPERVVAAHGVADRATEPPLTAATPAEDEEERT